MRSIRRVTLRVAPALASVASVFLFATCDFDKISGTPTKLTQSDVDRLFSITPTDTAIILGNSQLFSVAPGTGVSLDGTTTRWSSSSTSIVEVDSTGLANALAIGTATLTARLLAPELDTGYVKTHQLRVRYKAIKACANVPTKCSPLALDSIAGLNLSRPFNFYGTNINDALQQPALAGVTISTRDSGATTNTVASATGSSVFARRNGVAYVIGVFETLRDSIKVKVRQVAKSLTFPTTEYTANSLNANRTLPIVLKDVNDSVMTSSPLMRWRSTDPTVVTIDSLTGVFKVLKVDTAHIVVRVDTIEKSQALRVDQVVASLSKFAGDNVSDTVARVVRELPTVTALDSGNATIAGDTVIFSVGSGGGMITDSIQLTGADGKATVGSWQLGSIAMPQTLIATSAGSSVTFTVNGVPQRPFKLGFEQQPNATANGERISPAVTVYVRDSLSNLVTTATDSVFIALSNNPSAATLGGRSRAAAVNGVATFDSLTLNASGSGYTLIATAAGGLESTISDAFDVFDGATKLGFIRQPLATSAGAVMDTIRVAVQDAVGTIVSNDTRNITLSIQSGPGGGTLSGTTTRAAVAGVATFTGLKLSAAGAYELAATAAPLTAAVSNTVNISAVGAPTQLVFVNQPGDFASGATPSFQIQIQDANGALVTTSTAAVTVALTGGTAGAALTGTVMQNAVGGVATFPGLSIDKTGTGYKFVATSSGLTTATSNAFNVTSGSAAKLAFVDQPTHTVVSTNMSPSVTVAVQDANGNVVTTDAGRAITVSLFNCAGPSMTGTTTVNTVNGFATFGALAFGSTTGTGCRLSANSTGLTSGGSDFFSIVSPTGAIRLAFQTQPSQSTAGNVVPTFTVRVVDQSGTTVSGASPFITVRVLSGPTTTVFGTSSGTASGGLVNFTNFQLRTAGTYKLLATATGYKPDSSSSFTVVPGALNKVGWVVEPGNITAGAPFTPELSASFQDAFGNTIPSATGSIEIGVQNGPGGGTQVVGTRIRATADGVATFPGVTINTAFNGYTLFAIRQGGGIGAAFSSQFNVTPGPVSTLTLVNVPGNFTAGSLFSVGASATDAVGNTIGTFTNPITIGVSGGDGTATVVGTTTLTPVNGSASFTGLTIQKAGSNYRLTASASGLATATSDGQFTVFPASATKLTWIDQPQNTFQKAPLNPAPGGQTPRVAAMDQYDNIATNSFGQIRIKLLAPGGVQLREFGNPITQKDFFPSNGIVTLDGLTLTGVANDIQLTAESPFDGLTSANSDPFDLAEFAAKSTVTFRGQPVDGTYAVALNPAVEVAIEDDYGNTVTDASDQVFLSLDTDPNGDTQLGGVMGIFAVNGVAKFENLYLNKTGSGFKLQAGMGPGFGTAVSNSFSISSPGHVVDASSITDMARIGETIYWIESSDLSSIKSVAVTGGPITALPNSNTVRARRMATDGVDLYWIQEGSGVGTGSVNRYNIAAGNTTTLAQNLSNVREDANTFAVESGRVYFHALSESGLTAAIKWVPADAAGPQTPTDLVLRSPDDPASTQYFTVSGDNIYYFDNPTVTLNRIKWNETTPTTLTPGIGGTARQLLFGGTTLYYSTGFDIGTVPDADTRTDVVTPGTPVTGLPNFVFNMVLEGNNLYLKMGPNLRRYDVTTFGGGAFFVDLETNGQVEWETLLLDDLHLYYSDTSNGIGKTLK